MKNILKAFSIIPVIVCFKLSMIFSTALSEFDVTQVFVMEVFSSCYDRSKTVYFMLMSSLFPIILFQILFSRYIYEDFQISSVYVFSRCPDRKKWYYKKSLFLFGYTVIYIVSFTTTMLLISISNSMHAANWKDIEIYLMVTVSMTFFAYVTTLLLNLLAIRFGSSLAFVMIYLIFAVLMMMDIGYDKIPVLNQIPLLLKLNPISYLVVIWDIVNYVQILIYYLVFVLVVVLGGAFYISKLDIGLVDRENNS